MTWEYLQEELRVRALQPRAGEGAGGGPLVVLAEAVHEDDGGFAAGGDGWGVGAVHPETRGVAAEVCAAT